MPNTGREAFSPRINPRSQFPTFGLGILAPPVDASPTNLGSLKMNSLIATAPASVMIARFVPRTRSAGIPTMTPKTIATSDARIGASGKGMSHCIANFDSEKPATPANAIWARDG